MSIRSKVGSILNNLGLKKQVIQSLNKAGIGGFNTGDRILDIKLLIERSSENLLENRELTTGKRIAFAGVIPGMAEHPVTSGVIGAALRAHNSAVSAFLCDKSLEACELLHFTHFGKDDKSFLDGSARPACDGCFNPTKTIFEMLNLPVYSASAYRTPGDFSSVLESISTLSIEEIFSYKKDGLDIGEQVRTSVHRYQMKGILDNDEYTRKIALRYLASGIVYAGALKKFIEEWKPDVFIVAQGIYLFGGIVNEVCRSLNLRFYAWDYHYRKNGLIFSEGNTYHHELRLEPNEYWEALQMTDEKNKILDDYFSSRREGKLDKDEISYTSDSLLDGNKIISQLGIDKSKKVISFFTNVAWDGKVFVQGNLFEGPAELILESMEYLKNRDDLQIVIRIHPAEVLMKQWVGLQRMDTLIAERFPELPKNVILIAPEVKISSYGLAAISDLSVVYSTKLGLEVMLMGKQVLIGGDAFYQNKKFGIQPENKEQYWEVFNNLDKIGTVQGEELERVRKYAYHFFYRRTLEIPSLYKNTSDTITISDLSMLQPGKNKEVDRMCDSIITGRPFHINAE